MSLFLALQRRVAGSSVPVGTGIFHCFFPVVMLLGVTLLKKKYPMAKYLCVLLIVAGVALFMYKPKKVVGIEDHTVGYGELLLVRDPRGKGSLFQ